MLGTVRGVSTVVGTALAGLLIWVATQVGTGTTGEYWASYGMIAASGLGMALSQLFGGWTKWGWPRISLGVFLWGFLPILVCAGWVALAGQPDANWFRSQISSWSGHLAIGGLVSDLREYLGVLAFAFGLVLGFSFDTTGRVSRPEIAVYRREPAPAALEPTPPRVMPPAPEPRREPVGAGSGAPRRHGTH